MLHKIRWALMLAIVLLGCDLQANECDPCEEGCEARIMWRGQGRPLDCDPDSQKAWDCGYCGTWLPEDPILFRPFVADPRQLTYSAGWRFNDNAMTKNVIPVSFWDTIPFYRWFSVWPYCGQLELNLEGALWACFDPCTESAPLINADYYGGLSLTYAFNDWSFRLRFYHISSHIGDEYLLNHPDFDRRNPSAETIDFFFSQDLTDDIRYYGGAGYVVQHDESFNCSRYGIEAGAEVRLRGFGFIQKCTNFCGYPYYGMHFRYWNKFDKHVDQTYVLGYEFTKCFGLGRRCRFFAEFHDGYSLEGQFCREATTYFSLNASYGY